MKLRVLLIDDEAPARIAIRKLGGWDEDNTEFFEETDGVRALSCLETHPCHLVFVDMNMPNMDGMAFLKQASALYPSTCFIVVSGYDLFDYARSAIRAGAIDYLLKPVSRKELTETVSRAIRLLKESGTLKDKPAETKTPAAAPPISPEEAISRIRQDIDRNYARPIRISSYAAQYFFSQEYLTRLFKQHYQLSIQDYLLKVRMEQACRLLADPLIKVQDIALKVGYADNNNFSKAFRAYHGLSPSQYRAKHSR